jgi:hypothetical protein
MSKSIPVCYHADFESSKISPDAFGHIDDKTDYVVIGPDETLERRIRFIGK